MVYSCAAIVLLLLNNSCSVSIFPGYKSANDTVHSSPVSWFQTDTGHYLFNTKIDLMKNHFSGLMVIKPAGVDNYRVVMITETGLKILDMEFSPDKAVQVHYIMEAMNRKTLIKTLSNDISLVLMNHLSHAQPEILTEKGSGDAVFKYRYKGKQFYYYMHENEINPYFVKQVRGITHQVNAGFYGKAGTGPDSILISHQHIALTVHLYRIIEETGDVNE